MSEKIKVGLERGERQRKYAFGRIHVQMAG